MREVRSKILEWQNGGHAVALATVVKTWGSAPRPVGAKLAIADNGEMVGSVRFLPRGARSSCASASPRTRPGLWD